MRIPYRTTIWLGLFLVVATVAALYHPVIGFPLVWTDHAEIEEQTLVPRTLAEMGTMLVQAKGTAKAPARQKHLRDKPPSGYAYYRPVKALSYGLDWAVGGGRLWSFHLTNLLIHLSVSVLLLLVCRHLFGERHPFLPAGIALFHAVMPLHVETVAWVSARSDSLWGLFLLSGILFVQRARKAGAAWKHRLYPGLAGLMTLLAAGSKESGLVTAPILVAFSILIPDRKGWLKRLIREGWAPVAAVVLYALLRLTVIGDIQAGALSGRAIPDPWTLLDLLGRNLIQSFVPVGLTLADTLEVPGGPTVYGISGVVLLAAWLWAGIRLRKSHPVILFCSAGFLLSVLPVSQLYPLLHPRGERYLYVPALFSEVTLVYAGWWLAARLGRPGLRWLVAIAGGVVLAGLILLSHVRTGLWADERTLFAQAVREQPNCIECWNNLAYAEAVRGRHRRAELACRRALSIDRRRFLGARDGFSLRYLLIRSLLFQGRGHQALPWIWQLIKKGGPTPANLRLYTAALGQAAARGRLVPHLLPGEN